MDVNNPLKMVSIGIDPWPYGDICDFFSLPHFWSLNGRRGCCSFTGAAEVAVEEEVAVAPGM